MDVKAKAFGHPIHQMLIVFPLGLLATAIVFDAISLIGGRMRWTEIALYLIGAGLLGGIVSAVFGLIDYLGIPKGTRARAVGLLHGLGNAAVLILFAVSWALRMANPLHPGVTAYVLSFLGGGISVVTGWLGGELVDRLSVGVHPGAHPNAPSSLTKI